MTGAPDRIFSAKIAAREQLLENWPADWPRKENHVIQHDVTVDQYRAFESLVEKKVGERKIEKCLQQNREILSLAIWMFSTGHHMTWIFPKEQIRPSSGSIGGLIPDYVLAGANSNGVEWFVLELKGADTRAFTKSRKRVALSTEANRGVCQLLNYIDLASRDQAYLRDGLKLAGFREPRGVLLIGTDEETLDSDIQRFKSAWNRINPRLQIRSYSALLRDVKSKLENFNRL